MEPEELFERFFLDSLRDRLEHMAFEGSRSITIDFMKLLSQHENLALNLQKRWSEYSRYAVSGLIRALKFVDPDYAEEVQASTLQIFLGNYPVKVRIRELTSNRVGQLISFEGIVSRASIPSPMIVEACYICECGSETHVEQDNSTLKRPLKCPSCGRGSLQLSEEKSKYADYQELRVQEPPEELPPGAVPRHVDIQLKGELVEAARPGDKVTVTGILRAGAKSSHSKIFRAYVEACGLEVQTKEASAVEITREDEKRILELASSPDLYSRLTSSIAPSIYGFSHVKEAILYALAGGVAKENPDGTRIRGDIHILLVGDPGIAKTQLLKFAVKAAPRGVFVGGKGASGVGLTAACRREKDGEMVLEAGAMVIADMGVACIDELDKMSEEDRSQIHLAMEQQEVTIAKAGIHATLNSRCALLAAANPKLGRYEDRLTAAENIDLPSTILSRFDLIFVVKDLPETGRDRELAHHILNNQNRSPPIPPSLLRKYLAYARRVKPELEREAAKMLADYFVELRGEAAETPGAALPISARQLESLRRIAEARAKLALRSRVTVEDVQAALKLANRSFQDVGVLRNGEMDIDILLGTPKTLREKRTAIIQAFRTLNPSRRVSEEELKEHLKEHYGIDPEETERIIQQMVRNGEAYRPQPGTIQLL